MNRPWIAGLIGALSMFTPQLAEANQPPGSSIGISQSAEAREGLESVKAWLDKPTLRTAQSAKLCIQHATELNVDDPNAPTAEELNALRTAIIELASSGGVADITLLLDSLPTTWPVDLAGLMRALESIHDRLDAISKVEGVTLATGQSIAEAAGSQRDRVTELWRRADSALATQINAEIAELSTAAEAAVKSQQSAAQTQVAKDHDCDAADVLCLDEFGQALDGGLPHVLAQGRVVTVKVITPVANDDAIRLTIHETTRSSVTIEKQAPEEPKQSSAAPCALVPDEEIGFKIAATESFTVPKSLAIVEVVVEFERTPKAGEPIVARHRAWIDHGYYFVSVGLLFPFVPDGKQEVAARMIGTERYLALERDLHVTAGLAVNVFPGGRRRGELSPWSNLRCDTSMVDQSDCKKRRHRRHAAELLGLQFGTDLDVRDPLDQFYIGVVLEPVTGVTLSGGAAVLEMDELGIGLSPGQLVASDANLIARQRYYVKPYFAFGLGLDLVAAIRAARDRAEQLKP